MLKPVFFGIGTLVAGVATWAAVSACNNLDDTSPLFDPDSATDYDAGFVPQTADTDDPGGGSSGTPPSGQTANTLRVRLANLTQGGGTLELCYAQAPSTTFQVVQDVSTSQKIDAVATGTVSAPASIGPITTAATGKFQFAVGTDCTTKAGQLVSYSPSSSFKGGASITLFVAGDPSSGDSDSDFAPKLSSVTDTLSPSASATSFRAINGAMGLPPFNVVINGENPTGPNNTPTLQDIRFNTGLGYPYSSTTGYVPVAAGIPAGSTIALASGTTVHNFTVPNRVQRGVAVTMIVTGTAANVAASICSDRAPANGGTTADCFALSAAH